MSSLDKKIEGIKHALKSLKGNDGYWPKRLREWEPFDKITMEVVPRFKTSGLSGDTWRQHIQVNFWFKGEIVKEFGCRDMQAAIMLLGHNWMEGGSPILDAVIKLEDSRCFQPSCTNDAVGRFLIKEQFSDRGDKLEKESGTKYYRQFCAKHVLRGSASREDSDDNYEPLDDLKASDSTNVEESPSRAVLIDMGEE